MSAKLRRKESLGRALRRVCRLHAAQARASLKQGIGPAAVHGARKEIKKMRAIFRLTRHVLRGGEYRKLAEILRRTAKPLAASRDARATQKALETILDRKARQFPNIHTSLKAYCDQAERGLKANNSASVAKDALQMACDRLDDLDAKTAGWKDVRARLKEDYARGRQAWQHAKLHPTPEHLHEWRKRVKTLWYQLDFLCPGWPPKTKELLDGLEKLGDLLGNDHDLALLEQFALKHCGRGTETEGLRRLIDLKRQGYHRKIHQLGLRLYASVPDATCAQLEQDWKSWRNGG